MWESTLDTVNADVDGRSGDCRACTHREPLKAARTGAVASRTVRRSATSCWCVRHRGRHAGQWWERRCRCTACGRHGDGGAGEGGSACAAASAFALPAPSRADNAGRHVIGSMPGLERADVGMCGYRISHPWPAVHAWMPQWMP